MVPFLVKKGFFGQFLGFFGSQTSRTSRGRAQNKMAAQAVTGTLFSYIIDHTEVLLQTPLQHTQLVA